MLTIWNFPIGAYLFAVLGIVISIALPILRKKLPVPTNRSGFDVENNVYLTIGLFSALTAILMVAFGGESAKNWQWYTAILAGYAWDSTLQKIARV